jgi:hypothetical protein
MGRIEIPQCNRLLPDHRVLCFGGKHRRASSARPDSEQFRSSPRTCLPLCGRLSMRQTDRRRRERLEEPRIFGMRRRELLLQVLALAALASRASAQRSTQIYRIGFLTTASGPASRHRVLESALSELGYREGVNLVYERRYAAGGPAKTT